MYHATMAHVPTMLGYTAVQVCMDTHEGRCIVACGVWGHGTSSGQSNCMEDIVGHDLLGVHHTPGRQTTSGLSVVVWL